VLNDRQRIPRRLLIQAVLGPQIVKARVHLNGLEPAALGSDGLNADTADIVVSGNSVTQGVVGLGAGVSKADRLTWSFQQTCTGYLP
jgi:hypothetical protein